jgi:hypothetical protein
MNKISPSLIHGVYWNANPSPSKPHSICSICLRVYLNTFNLVISSSLFVHRCHVLNAIFLSGVFLLLPDRIRSRCEQRVRGEDQQHRRTNTYPSMNKSRRRILNIYFIWLSTTRQAAPSLNLWFQSISKLTILQHMVQLSFIDR